jgi:hypothetical protein
MLLTKYNKYSMHCAQSMKRQRGLQNLRTSNMVSSYAIKWVASLLEMFFSLLDYTKMNCVWWSENMMVFPQHSQNSFCLHDVLCTILLMSFGDKEPHLRQWRLHNLQMVSSKVNVCSPWFHLIITTYDWCDT